MIQCEIIPEAGKICQLDKESIPCQKIYYYRTKDNITLTKDQIISYFTELHKLNSTLIKNYIDSINEHNGIRTNYLHDKIYHDLLQNGLLQRDMFEWYNNGSKAAHPRAQITTLDYLKKTNQYNFTIALFNELFYTYLLISLKDFIFEYGDETTKEYIDTNKLIFNTLVYKKYYIMSLFDRINSGYFYKDIEQRYIINIFMQNTGDIWEYIEGYTFRSPNRIYRTYPATGKPIYNDDQPAIYAPSPSGSYYFELTDSYDTFIEFYQRIYLSIKNPPQGWTTEMMSKLELKLE